MGRRPHPTWTVTIDYTHRFPYVIKAKDEQQARERALELHKKDAEKYQYLEMEVTEGEE